MNPTRRTLRPDPLGLLLAAAVLLAALGLGGLWVAGVHQRAAERRTLKGKQLTTTAIQTPPPRRQGENGFKYKPQFGLVVPCKDEAEQQRRYKSLVKLGMAPKVVCV